MKGVHPAGSIREPCCCPTCDDTRHEELSTSWLCCYADSILPLSSIPDRRIGQSLSLHKNPKRFNEQEMAFGIETFVSLNFMLFADIQRAQAHGMVVTIHDVTRALHVQGAEPRASGENPEMRGRSQRGKGDMIKLKQRRNIAKVERSQRFPSNHSRRRYNVSVPELRQLLRGHV